MSLDEVLPAPKKSSVRSGESQQIPDKRNKWKRVLSSSLNYRTSKRRVGLYIGQREDRWALNEQRLTPKLKGSCEIIRPKYQEKAAVNVDSETS